MSAPTPETDRHLSTARSTYSLREFVAATGLLAATVAMVLLAATSPGTAALVGLAALGGHLAGRVRRSRRHRASEREFCVPHTGVCVRA